MVRSAAMILAALILPGIALAQQAQGSHTVVYGYTLWDLAQQYYQDPFDWRRIWEANRTDIADPNLILPGQVFVIPGTEPSAELTLYNTFDIEAVEGVLQVVGLADETSASRVLSIRDAVFEQGVVVRLTKKMR
jgi:LysM repeat protein